MIVGSGLRKALDENNMELAYNLAEDIAVIVVTYSSSKDDILRFVSDEDLEAFNDLLHDLRKRYNVNWYVRKYNFIVESSSFYDDPEAQREADRLKMRIESILGPGVDEFTSKGLLFFGDLAGLSTLDPRGVDIALERSPERVNRTVDLLVKLNEMGLSRYSTPFDDLVSDEIRKRAADRSFLSALKTIFKISSNSRKDKKRI